MKEHHAEASLVVSWSPRGNPCSRLCRASTQRPQTLKLFEEKWAAFVHCLDICK